MWVNIIYMEPVGMGNIWKCDGIWKKQMGRLWKTRGTSTETVGGDMNSCEHILNRMGQSFVPHETSPAATVNHQVLTGPP